MKNSTRKAEDTYLFDTYAIMEILEGNPSYEKYKKSDSIVTLFILSELAYNLIKKKGIHTAEKFVKKYIQSKADVGTEILLQAMNFRYENRKKKLSMTDCIGYKLSQSLGIKFLTGDRQFKEMKNVEFVE